MTRQALNQLIAKDLLKIRAVFFRPEEPFTWASGIKSPVYCDNRLTLTAPEVRTDVEVFVIAEPALSVGNGIVPGDIDIVWRAVYLHDVPCVFTVVVCL